MSEKVKDAERQKAQHEAKIKELEDVHAERLRAELDKQAETFKASATELEVALRSTYESQIGTLKRSHEEFVALLKETHESELAQSKTVSPGVGQVSWKLRFEVTGLMFLFRNWTKRFRQSPH